jgi:uncharacterized membrane protein YcaP (DUF421 family)
MMATQQPAVWVVPAALAVRTLAIAIVVIVGLRLFGKRQLGQMNIADLAAIMALANAVQNAMTNGTGLYIGGAASAATLLVLAAFLAFIIRRSPGLERPIVGSPSLLVWRGGVLWERLGRYRITVRELEMAAREHGLSGIDEIVSATLEIDGSISVVANRDQRGT